LCGIVSSPSEQMSLIGISLVMVDSMCKRGPEYTGYTIFIFLQKNIK
jgi:hypothetical protein